MRPSEPKSTQKMAELAKATPAPTSTTADLESASDPEALASLKVLPAEIASAASVEALAKLLSAHAGVQAAAGDYADAVKVAVAHVKKDDANGTVFCGWAVTSPSDWGWQYERVLVLTSNGLYRVACDPKAEVPVSACIATPLTQIKRVESGRFGFVLRTTQPDAEYGEMLFHSLYYRWWAGEEVENRYETGYFPSCAEGSSAEARVKPIVATILRASQLSGHEVAHAEVGCCASGG